MEQQEFVGWLSDYGTVSEMLKIYDYQQILEAAAAFLKVEPEVLERYPMDGYSKGRQNGDYRSVLEDLIKNIEHYDLVFARLDDEKSRIVFYDLVVYRIVPMPCFLKAACDAGIPQYFDGEIVTCDKNEVFVDCGGFVGDTTGEFIRQFKEYRRIYVYEPSTENMQECRHNLEKYPNIVFRTCGVGGNPGFTCVQGNGAAGTLAGCAEGDETEIISLDRDIKEKITFIKMDMGGGRDTCPAGSKETDQGRFSEACYLYTSHNERYVGNPPADR